MNKTQRKQKIGLVLGVPGCGKTTFINQVLEGKLPSFQNKVYRFQVYDCAYQDQEDLKSFQMMDSFGLQSETQADTPNHYMEQITSFYRYIHNSSFNRIFILCKFDRIATMKEQLTICIIPLRKYLNIITLVVTHFDQSTDDNKIKDEELIQKNIVKFFRLNSVIMSPNNLEGSVKQSVCNILFNEESTKIDLQRTKFDTKQFQNKELEEQLRNIGIQAKQDFIKEKERELALQKSYENEYSNYGSNNYYSNVPGLWVGFNHKIQIWQTGKNMKKKQAFSNYEYQLSKEQLVELTNNYRIRYVTHNHDQKQLYIMLYEDYNNQALLQDLLRVTEDYPNFGVFIVFQDAVQFEARSKLVNFIFIRNTEVLDDNEIGYNRYNNYSKNYTQNYFTMSESQNLNEQFDSLIKIKYPLQDQIRQSCNDTKNQYIKEQSKSEEQPEISLDVADETKTTLEQVSESNSAHCQRFQSPGQNNKIEEELQNQPLKQMTSNAINTFTRFQTQLYIVINANSGNYIYGTCHNLQQILHLKKHQSEMNSIRLNQDTTTDDQLFMSILNKQKITQIYVNEVKQQVFVISSGNNVENNQVNILDHKLMRLTIIIVFPMNTQLERQQAYGNQANLNFLIKNQSHTDTYLEKQNLVADQKQENKNGIKLIAQKNPTLTQPFNTQQFQKNQTNNIKQSNQSINPHQNKLESQVSNKNNTIQDKATTNQGLNKQQSVSSSSQQTQNKQYPLASGIQYKKPFAQKAQPSYINSASRRS